MIVRFRPDMRRGVPLSYHALSYHAEPLFVSGQTCDETYAVPDNGKIMLYKELKCPLDGFEMLLWSSGSRGHSYPFCPFCYNNPPFEGSKKGQGCNHCPHPTCRHSVVVYGVCPCLDCDTGVRPRRCPPSFPIFYFLTTFLFI